MHISLPLSKQRLVVRRGGDVLRSWSACYLPFRYPCAVASRPRAPRLQRQAVRHLKCCPECSAGLRDLATIAQVDEATPAVSIIPAANQHASQHPRHSDAGDAPGAVNNSLTPLPAPHLRSRAYTSSSRLETAPLITSSAFAQRR